MARPLGWQPSTHSPSMSSAIATSQALQTKALGCTSASLEACFGKPQLPPLLSFSLISVVSPCQATSRGLCSHSLCDVFSWLLQGCTTHAGCSSGPGSPTCMSCQASGAGGLPLSSPLHSQMSLLLKSSRCPQSSRLILPSPGPCTIPLCLASAHHAHDVKIAPRDCPEQLFLA